MIDLDEEYFEEHLRSTTSHKDDFSHYSYSSETSATSFSEFLSFLRIGNAIKDTTEILDKKPIKSFILILKTLTKIHHFFETE